MASRSTVNDRRSQPRHPFWCVPTETHPLILRCPLCAYHASATSDVGVALAMTDHFAFHRHRPVAVQLGDDN